MPLKLTSPAIEEGGVIPKKYACTGEGISPELNWGDAPRMTQSFALIFDDPDAPGGDWVHWVVYDLPANFRGLPESVHAGEAVPGGGRQGTNSWGNRAYGCPCPPAGSRHTYVFRLYALDTVLNLEAGATKRELLAAMSGHILAQTALRGTFTR